MIMKLEMRLRFKFTEKARNEKYKIKKGKLTTSSATPVELEWISTYDEIETKGRE